MAILLIVLGAIWAVIGLGDIVSMPWGGEHSSALLTFGLMFNVILFVIPGLILFGIGGLLGRNRSRPKAPPVLEAPAFAQLAEPERKPCPHCAELIVATARVCRFCSRELPQRWAESLTHGS
jgi:hypothetical protein